MAQSNFFSTTTASGTTYILRMLPEVWSNVPTLHPPIHGPPRYPVCDCSSGLVDFDVRVRMLDGSGYIRKSFYCIECEIDKVNYHLDLGTRRGAAHVQLGAPWNEVSAVAAMEVGELVEVPLTQPDEVLEITDDEEDGTEIQRFTFESDDEETRL